MIMAAGPANPDNSSLEDLRRQIDALDDQIVPLLNARAQIVVQIGKLKQQSGVPIYAPDREKAVLEKVRAMNKGPLANRCLEAVYRELMSGSFALEKPLRIGFLGPEGTFSHAAAVRKFGSSVEYLPMADILSVFEEVVRGHIDYGLGAFRAEAFDCWSDGQTFDLSDVYQRLLADGELAAFEVPTRFYEIGSLSGLEETREYLTVKGASVR
jgi:chorismate mutase-like protein